jgi:hypothetical protein
MTNRADLATRAGAVLNGRQRRGRLGKFSLTLACVATVMLVASLSPLTLVATPQETQPASGERHRFDVASVKPTASSDGRALLQATPGRLEMSNIAPRRLILNAYDIQDYQLVGSPGWIDSDHYDIQAKADGNPTVRQMEGPMLQALLEERFQLLLHRETRQLAVYKLSVGKSGAKLRASQEGSCTPTSRTRRPQQLNPESLARLFVVFFNGQQCRDCTGRG